MMLDIQSNFLYNNKFTKLLQQHLQSSSDLLQPWGLNCHLCFWIFPFKTAAHRLTWMTTTQQLTSHSLLDFIILSKTLSDLKFYQKLFYKWWKYSFDHGQCLTESVFQSLVMSRLKKLWWSSEKTECLLKSQYVQSDTLSKNYHR